MVLVFQAGTDFRTEQLVYFQRAQLSIPQLDPSNVNPKQQAFVGASSLFIHFCNSSYLRVATALVASSLDRIIQQARFAPVPFVSDLEPQDSCHGWSITCSL